MENKMENKPEYIVIVFGRKNHYVVSATTADNEQQAKQIQSENTNEYTFATVVPCDYSMRNE